MKKPENIAIGKFKYNLPESQIAPYPLAERDKSKLLVYRNGNISSGFFHEIDTFLNPDTHLVFNNSRVIHARLKFRKKTGAQIEIFCLEPLQPYEYQLNFSTIGSVEWKCVVGNSKKWKNERLQLFNAESKFTLYAKRIKKEGAEERIRFSWNPASISFSEIIEVFGNTPIPPYLGREAEKPDALTYQTIYSKHEGSVAAPTAGLHFTEGLLDRLEKKSFSMSEVTLHVGAGTFIPVRTENGLDHKMHVERFHVQKNSLEHLIRNHEHITPVGTTSCRTLESLYWMGVKMLMKYPDEDCAKLDQFEAYDLDQDIPGKKALEAILDFLEKENRDIFFGSTGIMISPGYTFRMTDCLLTNFHQPSSTLLMLIAALVGDKWQDIYEYALKNDFRFLSYGDSSLLYPS